MSYIGLIGNIVGIAGLLKQLNNTINVYSTTLGNQFLTFMFMSNKLTSYNLACKIIVIIFL